MKEESLNSQIPEAMRSIYKITQNWWHRELHENGELRYSWTSDGCLIYLSERGLFWISNNGKHKKTKKTERRKEIEDDGRKSIEELAKG